ncbi:MAG: hypothetical protein KJ607_11985 [Bacteroidetes bacterium]|nr:hypothetical protein [Bacteroidota bacterium]
MKTGNSIRIPVAAFLTFAAFIASAIINPGCAQHHQDNVILNGDTLTDNKPKVDIKVNKEYDKNGNIIRYDSSYTAWYNFRGGDVPSGFDSLFFPMPYMPEFDPGMNPFDHFMTDPFFADDFFNHDFFRDEEMDEFYNDPHIRENFLNSFEKRMEKMNRMFREMDSLMYYGFPKPFVPKTPVAPQPDQQPPAKQQSNPQPEKDEPGKSEPAKVKKMI